MEKAGGVTLAKIAKFANWTRSFLWWRLHLHIHEGSVYHFAFGGFSHFSHKMLPCKLKFPLLCAGLRKQIKQIKGRLLLEVCFFLGGRDPGRGNMFPAIPWLGYGLAQRWESEMCAERSSIGRSEDAYLSYLIYTGAKVVSWRSFLDPENNGER